MPGPNGEECKVCYYWEGHGDGPTYRNNKNEYVLEYEEGDCVIVHTWTPKKDWEWCGEYRHRIPPISCRSCGHESKPNIEDYRYCEECGCEDLDDRKT